MRTVGEFMRMFGSLYNNQYILFQSDKQPIFGYSPGHTVSIRTNDERMVEQLYYMEILSIGGLEDKIIIYV